MRLSRTVLVYLFLGLFSVSSFAGLQEDFAALKNSGTDFTVIGVICEQVAKLELEETYPSTKYTVETGIQYGDGRRAFGELDVIVFEKATGRAVLVGEVKCWKDLNGALRKASKQRQRFLSYINSNAKLVFMNTTNYRNYDQDQFEGIRQFVSIAQKGAESAGFTDELPYSLEELMGLRQRLMDCQHAHECKRPVKYNRDGSIRGSVSGDADSFSSSYFKFGRLAYDSFGEPADCASYLR